MRVLIILLILLSACAPQRKPDIKQIVCDTKEHTVMGCCFKVQKINYGIRCWVSQTKFYDIEHAMCSVYNVVESEIRKRCRPR